MVEERTVEWQRAANLQINSRKPSAQKAQMSPNVNTDKTFQKDTKKWA